MKTMDTVVIGAGLSGLSAAYYLQKKGINAKIFEVAKQVGGRVRSDNYEGYILDRGLHFYHHSTTELSKIINQKQLELKNLYPGYLLRYGDDFNVITNPLLQTLDTFSTAISKNATWSDKLKLFGLYMKLKTSSYNKIVKEKEYSTFDFFKKSGFSNMVIDSFFRPLLGSLIFDNQLQSSSKFSKIYLKSVFDDSVSMPKNGIGMIPKLIAEKLQPGSICLGTKVKKIHKNAVEFTNGNILEAKKIIIATNAIDANLIEENIDIQAESTHLTTIYFSANNRPNSKPIITLNGNNDGLVNHIFVPTNVHENYAPKGKHLISVNICKEHQFDDEELITEVLCEMAKWYGLQVNEWQHLKTYHIKYAMPFKPILDEVNFYKQHSEHIYLCGDSFSVGSMESAIRSGREVAECIIANRPFLSKKIYQKDLV